jgi:hypothetical protein
LRRTATRGPTTRAIPSRRIAKSRRERELNRG